MKIRQHFLIAILLFLICTANSLFADNNQQIQHLLTQLSDGKSDEEHLQAIEDLEKIGGQIIDEVFEAYRLGNLYIWQNEVVTSNGIIEDSNYIKNIRPVDIFTKEYKKGPEYMVPVRDLETIAAGRNERKALASALLMVQLTLDNSTKENRKKILAAADKLAYSETGPRAVPLLEKLAVNSKSKKVCRAAGESLGLITLQYSDNWTDKDKAIEELGRIKSLKAVPLLNELLKEELPEARVELIRKANRRIGSKRGWINFFNIIKASLSTGSILILMALGLAITFGMMGVINMAHGEMMMIGAYVTYIVQIIFKHSAEHPVPIFFAVALPLAFAAAAAIGGLIEWLVVRRLYKKPFESLLATYGISLIIVQLIRLIFGDNRATNSPKWLQGAVELTEGFAFPTNRIFILILTIICILIVWALFRYTKLGLNMRATMQNRAMAAAMGINTRRVDSYTFMLGSGIAGIAGYALTTVGGITPDMGKNYLVDSFLVVVTGGVGQLAGVVSAGMGIGFINKFLDGTFLGTVWAKILVLVLVITFIQIKPSGLFSPKGRLADD